MPLQANAPIRTLLSKPEAVISEDAYEIDRYEFILLLWSLGVKHLKIEGDGRKIYAFFHRDDVVRIQSESMNDSDKKLMVAWADVLTAMATWKDFLTLNRNLINRK